MGQFQLPKEKKSEKRATNCCGWGDEKKKKKNVQEVCKAELVPAFSRVDSAVLLIRNAVSA